MTRSLFPAAGPVLLVVSAIAFSSAGFFARAVPADPVTVLFWRNLHGGIILLPFAFKGLGGLMLRPNLRTWFIIALSAFGSICYIAAFSFTSVANISIIYAAAPMITAAMAWAMLRERMAKATLVAVLVAFVGVALTALGGVSGQGTALGDGLALLMTFALSAVAVFSRGQSFPPLALSCASALLAALVIMPAQPTLVLTPSQFLWLTAFGAVTMAIALPCYLLGLRTVPAGRAMLISAIELPLAPLWVRLAFGEVPSVHAAVGGLIVSVAVAWDLFTRRPARVS